MTSFFNLTRLLNRAWKEKALKKGHVDIVIPDNVVLASSQNGGPTTKRPMKDLVDSVCEAVYEEFEPPLRYLPYFEKPLSVIIVPGLSNVTSAAPGSPGIPVTIPGVSSPVFHNLGRMPKGYIVTYQDAPAHIYSNKALWTPTTISLSANILGLVPTPLNIEVLVF